MRLPRSVAENPASKIVGFFLFSVEEFMTPASDSNLSMHFTSGENQLDWKTTETETALLKRRDWRQKRNRLEMSLGSQAGQFEDPPKK